MASKALLIRSLVSIHDVMPHNLDKIDFCLEQLKFNGIDTCYLLVVPGLDWDEKSIARLRQYVADGHELAAHGWLHKAAEISSLYHRLHSVLMSRDVAEHLCWSRSEALSYMRSARDWFADKQLPVPDFYVPPAWALGDLTPYDLSKTGFNYVETTTGIFDLRSDRFYRLPLVGFEARTPFSAAALRITNVTNRVLKRLFLKRSLRVSIHPDDFDLLLSASLKDVLARLAPELIECTIDALDSHQQQKRTLDVRK